ncbi:MAG: periplasmic heavy metal sensor [Bacteroidetes bacterium]|nr:periplasmic heavy metal sensor [Bacteroidota bacterium]
MKSRFFFFAVLLFSFSFALFSQPMNGPRRGVNQLNLTDQQKDQFQKIHFDTQKKNIELTAKLATARVDLKQMLLGDKQEKSAVEKKLKEISDLQVSLKMNRFNDWTECNKILTPEQQKIWKQQLQRHLLGAENRRPMMNNRRPSMQNRQNNAPYPRHRMMQNIPQN